MNIKSRALLIFVTCFLLIAHARANEKEFGQPEIREQRPAASPVFQTNFDCTRVEHVLDNLICHDAHLAFYDRKLAEIERAARSGAIDPDALDAYMEHQRSLRNWFCTDRDCLSGWYSKQMEAMAYVVRTGTIPINFARDNAVRK